MPVSRSRLENADRESAGQGLAQFLAGRELCAIQFFGARICSGVCACVQTIMGSAMGLRRHPVAMRSICCAALRPSLPAQISVAYGRPLIRSKAGVVGAIEEILHHSGHRRQILRSRKNVAVRLEHILGSASAARSSDTCHALSLRAPAAAACAICRVPPVME